MTRSISVSCMTRGPGTRVAAMLSLLRPVADEIVVAIDDRADEEVDWALASVADRLLRFPFAEPVDRPLPWLHAQCSGDWVLTIDDDEIPSAALIGALPELVSARDSTHFLIPRRWLFPDAGHYLDGLPWQPDYQLRLVQNDFRLLDFPIETHRPIAVLGPGRRLEHPIYHADCIANPLPARARKARHYEHLYAGRRIAGRPLNHAYYLPEHDPQATTRLVPPDDHALIRSVLSATPVAGSPPTGVLVAAREDIDRWWGGRTLSDDGYRARLTLLESTARMHTGEVRAVDVRLENLSAETWPGRGRSGPEIRLCYRWRSERDIVEGARSALPADVLGGASTVAAVDVAAPRTAGAYRLEIDLVHEHVRWFDCSAACDVRVVPSRRQAILHSGSNDALRTEVERLAEAEPEIEPVVLTCTPDELRVWYAGAVAPSPERYLRSGLPVGRMRRRLLLGARIARMLHATRRAARGPLDTRLSPELAAFVDALAPAERLLLTKGPAASALRDRLVTWTTVLAARALGVEIVR